MKGVLIEKYSSVLLEIKLFPHNWDNGKWWMLFVWFFFKYFIYERIHENVQNSITTKKNLKKLIFIK